MLRTSLALVLAAPLVLAACGDDDHDHDHDHEELGSEFLVAGDIEPGCSTGVTWTGDDFGTGLMHPGGNCNACHATSEGDDVPEPFTAAGTVHGARDDADDCGGVQGVTVRLRGFDGTVVELTTNAAGNFYTHDPIPTPYTAEVELDGQVLEMGFQPSDGNCTSCHTQTGLGGAPGRVRVP